jgi:hypothetical protein
VEEYYWYFGFALARSNRCAEAVPIFRALLSGVPQDDVAVYNATEGLALCQQNIGSPAAPTSKAGTPTFTPPPKTTPTP